MSSEFNSLNPNHNKLWSDLPLLEELDDKSSKTIKGGADPFQPLHDAKFKLFMGVCGLNSGGEPGCDPDVWGL